MAWISLFVAGLLEIAWAYSMKKSEGFTLLMPSILTFILMVGSVSLLALSMRTLPLGTAYTIWTGIGAIGAFLLGILVLGEPASFMRLLAGAFIIVGIILMKTSDI